MIEASGLTKRYGAKTAVDHISFAIEPGTVTGFLGPNGAGKSTTMRLIMGLDKPTESNIKSKFYLAEKGAARQNPQIYASLDTKA